MACVCRGAGWGGGGPCAAPPVCAAGRACRAEGGSASFRPSAFPGQATKRVSLHGVALIIGGVVPIPLWFVLACLHSARSAQRPGALARARLFPAVPMGAGS